jgi:hypothetical protein
MVRIIYLQNVGRIELWKALVLKRSLEVVLLLHLGD